MMSVIIYRGNEEYNENYKNYKEMFNKRENGKVLVVVRYWYKFKMVGSFLFLVGWSFSWG